MRWYARRSASDLNTLCLCGDSGSDGSPLLLATFAFMRAMRFCFGVAAGRRVLRADTPRSDGLATCADFRLLALTTDRFESRRGRDDRAVDAASSAAWGCSPGGSMVSCTVDSVRFMGELPAVPADPTLPAPASPTDIAGDAAVAGDRWAGDPPPLCRGRLFGAGDVKKPPPGPGVRGPGRSADLPALLAALAASATTRKDRRRNFCPSPDWGSTPWAARESEAASASTSRFALSTVTATASAASLGSTPSPGTTSS